MDRLIPTELSQLILTHADFLSQIRLRCVCKLFYNKLEINNFYYIGAYSSLLTDSVLQAYPFITELNASRNTKITDVNHLTRLRNLNAYDYCGIGDNGIRFNTNLVELAASSNYKITNVNHLTNLRVLLAEWDCGIDNFGIQNLNLKELSIGYNSFITDLNHMTRLEILCADGSAGIDDESIRNLNLKELYVCDNIRITNVNHMTNLEILYASRCSGIDDMGICELKKLKELYSEDNDKITIKIDNANS